MEMSFRILMGVLNDVAFELMFGALVRRDMKNVQGIENLSERRILLDCIIC